MDERTRKILNAFSPGKIVWPILIGIGVSLVLLLRNFNSEAFEQIHWTWYSSIWILLAFLMVAIRDGAYMYRIRVLTGNEISWRKSFDVIMLWEFASALAPMILGGGFAFAILIINKENIKMGKSIAVVMFTSFLDGLFFAIIAPIIYLLAGKTSLFNNLDAGTLQKLANGAESYYIFWFVYTVVLVYKAIVAYALFVNPRAIKMLLMRVFSIGFLKKWKMAAMRTGQEMEIASKELKGQSLSYWFKSAGATFITWTARFVIVNCIVMAFAKVDISHFILYARQVVMGLIMLAGFTPGGTGVAEILFSNFLGEFIPNGLAPSLALLWRLISYYPYLFIGAIVLPRWVKRVFKVKE